MNGLEIPTGVLSLEEKSLGIQEERGVPASKEALVKPWGLRPHHANEQFPFALSLSSDTGWLSSLLKGNCTYRKVDRTELPNTL